MNKVRIAHCADIHIGSDCKILGTKSEIRKYEIKSTFYRILDECVKENVDLLLIAGDFFEDVNASDSVIQEIKDAIQKVDLKVVISPGNHDPVTADSPYNIEWPENVIIFKTPNMNFVEINDLNVRIWGAGFSGMYEKSTLLKNINFVDDDLINICVMHGDLTGDYGAFYNPINLREIENSKMDYVALGHIHKRTDICHIGDTFYAYSGCPEGRGFDELGEKGFYIGDISKSSCDLKFKKICRRMNLTVEVDISKIGCFADTVSLILDRLKSLYGMNYQENLYKIILYGNVPEELMIDIKAIEAELSGRLFFVKILDNTEIYVDIEKLQFNHDFKGVFVKKMMERIGKETSEENLAVIKQALKLGLKAFSGEVKYSDD